MCFFLFFTTRGYDLNVTENICVKEGMPRTKKRRPAQGNKKTTVKLCVSIKKEQTSKKSLSTAKKLLNQPNGLNFLIGSENVAWINVKKEGCHQIKEEENNASELNMVTEVGKSAEFSQTLTVPRRRGRPRKVRSSYENSILDNSENSYSELDAPEVNFQNDVIESSSKMTRLAILKTRQSISDSVQENKSDSVQENKQFEEASAAESVCPLSDIQKQLLEYQNYIHAPETKKQVANKKMIDTWKEELELHNKIQCRRKLCCKTLSSLGGMIYHYERACQRKWTCTVCQEHFKNQSNKLLLHMKGHFVNGTKILSQPNDMNESSSSITSLDISKINRNQSMSDCTLESDCTQVGNEMSFEGTTSKSGHPASTIDEKLTEFQNYIRIPKIEKQVANEKLVEKWKKELDRHEIIRCKQEDCGKILRTVSGMVYHYETACQRKWTCMICNKVFKGSVKLIQHMRKHFPKRGMVLDVSSQRCKRDDKAEVFQAHVHAFFSKNKDNLNWAKSFKPKKSSWNFLNSKKYKRYLPLVQQSMLMACQNLTSENDTPSWFNLSLFQSSFGRGDSSAISFFAGSRISSSAWCPTRYNFEATQYICLATCKTVINCKNTENNYDDDGKGLLQLWSVDNLNTSRMVEPPKLSLAIAHAYGPVREIVWCPQGCWEDPSTVTDDPGDFIPRLGILAIACADSCVRLYSIPHPHALGYISSDLPICTTDPVYVLRPRFGVRLHTQKLECTAISWQRNSNCSIIMTGYNNGFVCLFEIPSSVPTETCDIYPYSLFFAHSSAVTSVVLAPLPGNWAATGCWGKIVKVWNLDDTSQPVRECKQGFVKSISWTLLWPGVFASFDGLETKSTAFLDFSCFRRLRKISSTSSSCEWAHSVSEWLNAIAMGDAFGTSTISVMRKYKHSNFSYSFPLFRTEVVAVIKSEDTSCNRESEFQQTHGLKFIDCDSISVKNGGKSESQKKVKESQEMKNDSQETEKKSQEIKNDSQETEKKSQEIENGNQLSSCFGGFQFAAVDSVKWNPNFGSHSWIFCVGQSGLVRLIHVPELTRN